jgi:hypothetical protein
MIINLLFINLPHSLSSTSTPATAKFPQNDESFDDEANTTINESALVLILITSRLTCI